MSWLQKLMEDRIERSIRSSPEYLDKVLYRFQYRVDGGYDQILIVEFEGGGESHHKRYTLPELMQLLATPST